MATVAKRLIDGSLMVAALAIYYTVPLNSRAVTKRVSLSNGTANHVDCAIHLVPSGAGASAANKVAARTLSPGETQTIPEAEGQVLEGAGTIQASGLNVAIVASGVEIA